MTAHTTAAPEFQSSYGGLGPAIVGVCWSLFCLATILVGSRIYTHLTLVKSKGGWALFWACVAYVRILRSCAMDIDVAYNICSLLE